MTGVLVDSNILLDILLDDPDWADWSETALADAGQRSTLYINQIVYAEVSIAFQKIEELESALHSWWISDVGNSQGSIVSGRKSVSSLPKG